MPTLVPSFLCPECGIVFPTQGVCPTHGKALVSTGSDPMLGKMVGSYRVVSVIGEGGMGRVYKGLHPSIGSRVAIKVLTASAAQDRNAVARFFAEARAVNIVRHEGIVNVLDLATSELGEPYMVMEYLDGSPLDGLLKKQGALDVQFACRLVCEVLRALEAAHAAGVVHRDLKPANVFVSPAGHAKVLDFGIVKLRADDGAAGLTQSGALLGTPYYMSPEQAASRPADARSDLYSAGVILYESLTGARPFNATSLYELLRQHLQEQPPSPRARRAELSPALEAVVLRSLEKEPSRRFQSAADFRMAIERALAGAAVAPGPVAVAATPPVVVAASPQVVIAATPPAMYAAPMAQTPQYAMGITAPQPTVQSGGWVWKIALAVVAILLVVAAAGTAGIWVLAKTLGELTPQPRIHRVEGFNPRRFDAVAFVARAQAIARGHQPDAELSSIQLEGVGSDGLIDLAGASGRSAVYTWLSTRAAEKSCVVSVAASADGVTSIESNVGGCGRPRIPPPNCDLVRVLGKARASGGFDAGTPVSAVYSSELTGGVFWVVRQGAKTLQIADDCPAPKSSR
ncbi:MAG: protein kinase [Deltaproteobacteria bacterium]|nr:protein kinase [Deltaproteobacteria bacterium]